MAIDKVRENHERLLKIGLCAVAGIWLAVEIWNGVQEQTPWLELNRRIFFSAATLLTALLTFVPTPAFILTWGFLSFGLWLEAHGFKDGLAFYKGLGVYGWMFLLLWLLYSGMAVLVALSRLRKVSTGATAT